MADRNQELANKVAIVTGSARNIGRSIAEELASAGAAVTINAVSARLVQISTDYVFNGEKGNYREDDPVFPVNKYAWSKLGGECAVLIYDNSLVVRTSFGPSQFPFEKAFADQWTSRESVGAIAGKIVEHNPVADIAIICFHVHRVSCIEIRAY